MSPSSPSQRLGTLLGMNVVLADGTPAGRVNDVRLSTPRQADEPPGALLLTGVMVGRRRGSRLGYDRREQQGPWLVQTVVNWWQRDQRFVRWEEIDSIDWERGTLTLRASAS